MNDHSELNSYFEALRAQVNDSFGQKHIDKETSNATIQAINEQWQDILEKIGQLESECIQNNILNQTLTIMFLKTGDGLLDDKLLIMNMPKTKFDALINNHANSLTLTADWIKIKTLQNELKNPNHIIEFYFDQLAFINLNLTETQLTGIETSAFIGFTNLKVLDLSKNSLLEIQSNVFNDLIHLEELNLSENKLTMISADAFQGLRNLKILICFGNSLSSLDPNAFNGLFNLKCLDFYLNKITSKDLRCFHTLKSLEELNLSFNYIASIEDDSFRGLINLKKLNLSYNRIAMLAVNSLQCLTNLKELSLSYNNISVIDVNVFQGLSSLNELEMFKNKLSSDSLILLHNYANRKFKIAE